MKKLPMIFTAAFLFALFAVESVSAESDYLSFWRELASGEDGRRLDRWLRLQAQVLLGEVSPDAASKSGIQCPNLPQRAFGAGLFVTLLDTRGRNRGCYGSFWHRSASAKDALSEYLAAALREDPRSQPIARWELDNTKIIVTAAGAPFPVASLEEVDISSYGVFVSGDGGGGVVFVPAEIRTHARLASLCKTLLAEAQGIYAFRAVTIGR